MFSFFDNHINPLLLRELRQLVRNRFIIVLIHLYIAFLVTVCLMCVLLGNDVPSLRLGSQLFDALTFVMGTACLLAVVVYTAATTASERINGDLMYISSMKPSSIVFGKALSGVILTTLLMSITAPFVMLAYLLRGLDIEWVTRTFLYAFILVQVMNTITICIASNVKSKPQMVVVSVIGFFAIIVGFPHLVTHFYSGSAGGDWTVFIQFFLSASAVIALFLAITVSYIAPPTSNRRLPVRLVMTIIYLGSLNFCFVNSSISLLHSWVSIWFILLMLLILITICEPETWSARIKRTIPKRILFRFICFPFYTGAANGFVWIALMFFGILGVIFFNPSTIHGNESPLYWLLFSFDYCVTAMLLRVTLVPKRFNITPERTWVLVLSLFVLLVPGGMLVFFWLDNHSASPDFLWAYSKSVFSSISPFMQVDLLPQQITTATYWGLALLLPFLIWFGIRAFRFTPKNDGKILTLEQAIIAVREADSNPLVQSEKERKRKSGKSDAAQQERR
jgi:hypothetical protein